MIYPNKEANEAICVEGWMFLEDDAHVQHDGNGNYAILWRHDSIRASDPEEVLIRWVVTPITVGEKALDIVEA